MDSDMLVLEDISILNNFFTEMDQKGDQLIKFFKCRMIQVSCLHQLTNNTREKILRNRWEKLVIVIFHFQNFKIGCRQQKRQQRIAPAKFEGDENGYNIFCIHTHVKKFRQLVRFVESRRRETDE